MDWAFPRGIALREIPQCEYDLGRYRNAVLAQVLSKHGISLLSLPCREWVKGN